ncbi:MAG TPA: hypothetical protein ENK21_06970 [Trueperaceae bacterium]|nr:hypothetical protein [Trueperaceae bacterium]
MELVSYRLSYRGKAVGNYSLSADSVSNTVFLEAKMMLQGSLGTTTINQTSKTNKTHFFSYSFQELTNSPGQNRRYNVIYDKNHGLIKASRSASDKSEIPAITPIVDPIGLLYKIRHLDLEKDRFLVPMLGKTVIISKIAQKELDTAFGKKMTNVYKLHPGKSLVYVDIEKPHHILAMTQYIGNKFLDSFIVKVENIDSKKRTKSRYRPRKRMHRRRNNKNK